MHSYSLAAQPIPIHRHVPPPPANPFKRALVRMAITAGAVVGLLVVIPGGIWVHSQVTPQHTVLVDNGNDFPVEVTVGSRTISMQPRSVASIPAWSGEVSAKAKGTGFEETYTLEMPDVGWSAGGRSALFNVGGRSQLALVRMTYGSPASAAGRDAPPVTPLAKKDRFTLLPANVSGAIDEGFPKSVKIKGWGTAITHVCRVDATTRHVGCGIP